MIVFVACFTKFLNIYPGLMNWDQEAIDHSIGSTKVDGRMVCLHLLAYCFKSIPVIASKHYSTVSQVISKSEAAIMILLISNDIGKAR